MPTVKPKTELETKHITKQTPEIEAVKRLYYAVFPKEEQTSMRLLLCKAKKSFVDFLAFYDEGMFAGFVYAVTKNDLTYVLYLAVSKQIQSKGYGSRILRQFESMHPQNRIILEIEEVDPASDNYEQRKRRKTFYEKNAYHSASFITIDRGVRYELMVKNGDCTVLEYRQLLQRFRGSLLHFFFKPKFLEKN